MHDFFARIWNDLAGRLTGPMNFRLFLQPGMASLFAIRDAIRDARNGQPAYFWSLFRQSVNRSHRLRTGWKAISRVFILAVAMDVIYQIRAFHRLYPGEALLVAVGLAIVPYLLLRGPINRIITQYNACRRSVSQHDTK